VNQGERGPSHIRDGFEIIEKLENKPNWAFANFVMGKLEMAREQYDSAMPYLQVCIDAINANPVGIDNTILLTALGFQSVALEETGQSEKATAALQEIGRLKEQLGDTSTNAVFNPAPVFPGSVNLQQTGTRLDVEQNEGSVMIVFDVDENGFTTNHRIEASVGPAAYVNAALDALKRSRYAPLYVGGRPTVMTNLRFQYRFLISP
jgi:TonB family protein